MRTDDHNFDDCAGRGSEIASYPHKSEWLSYDLNQNDFRFAPCEELSNRLADLMRRTTDDVIYPALQHGKRVITAPLPNVMVTPQALRHCRGSFTPQVWQNADGELIDQISIDLSKHPVGSVRSYASTLASQRIHQAQYHFGAPGGDGYCNKQRADWMTVCGLQTSATGRPGGRRTGRSMGHYIISDGIFDQFVTRLESEGFSLPWEVIQSVISASGASLDDLKEASKKRNKQKFTCPRCGQNSWAKPNAKMLCGHPICRQTVMEPA